MTALCGGGTSGPQAGVGSVITLTSIGVEAFVAGLGFPEIAPTVAAIVAGITTIDVAAYCGTDPPADPVLTSTDLVNAIDLLDPSVSLPAQARVAQWFLHRYWWQICQCTSGTATPPAAPSNPGIISTNPGIPKNTNAICFSGSVTDTTLGFTGPGLHQHDLSPNLLPPGASIISNFGTVGSTTGVTMPAYAIPAGATSITWAPRTILRQAGISAGAAQISTFNVFDASGNHLGGLDIYQTLGAAVTPTTIARGTTSIWPTAGTHWSIACGAFVGSGVTVQNQTQSIDTTIACTGFPLETPCCPPDPTIENKLNQIIGLVQAIFQSLPVPINSLSEGAVHAGLTGSGSFATAAPTIAAKVNVTTIPGYVGLESVDPTQYFDLGWFTTSAAEGNYKSRRIEKVPELYWLDPLTDQLHYTLNPGVVATITELSRGP